MNREIAIDALRLPGSTRVDQRVPKKTLTEQGAPTAADKRHIQEGIEELLWVAALKPNNIGVPLFRDSQREYLEIAVLSLALRSGAKDARVMELIHRAVPYPVFLVASLGESVTISLANKRYSEGQQGKFVVDESIAVSLDTDKSSPDTVSAFLVSLAISTLPITNLLEFYEAWLNRVVALKVSQITGVFALPESYACALSVKDDLDGHLRLTREIQALRTKAAGEKQLSRRVDLNLEIKRLESDLNARGKRLRSSHP